MSVSADRFIFALSHVRPEGWQEFERLSSRFLVSDFPNLRTTASTSGDKGRDAELFTSDAFPKVLFQFSVQEKWSAKIAATLKTVSETFPDYDTVIFISSQQIGARGDEWRNKARNDGRNLDIRDRNWFVDRFELDTNRSKAAEDFSNYVADPILRSGVETSTSALHGQEARTALVYLEMQAKDENAAKGLTKSCFDALVRCVLRDTSSDSRMTRSDVHANVAKLLPQHTPKQLIDLVDSALKRLSKNVVKVTGKTDEFHISFEEMKATKEKVASLNNLLAAFNADIEDILRSDPDVQPEMISQYVALTRNVVEVYFYKLGEEFVQAVANGKDLKLNQDALNTVIHERIKGKLTPTRHLGDFIKKVATETLTSPSNSAKEYLRLLSTAYTLFAFLSEVPDVQKATKRLFEHATIWLDTSAVLPLVAEQALPEDSRPFTDMYLQLRKAGTNLVVTSGVLDEVVGHLNICKSYSRSTAWTGRTPYVIANYIVAGKPKAGFEIWSENFAGSHRPGDDVAEFLADIVGITREVPPDFSPLDQSVVNAVRDYWHEVHDRRRESGFNLYNHELATHDAENYLAALAQRKGARTTSAFGYTSWYLSLDNLAWKLKASIPADVSQKMGYAPMISLDFLIKYLGFGPRRDQVDTTGLGWSRIFTETILTEAPEDLSSIATQVRIANADKSERIIQRRIRDELDQQRMAMGEAQRQGLGNHSGGR